MQIASFQSRQPETANRQPQTDNRLAIPVGAAGLLLALLAACLLWGPAAPVVRLAASDTVYY